MTLETTQTLVCDRCGAREVLGKSRTYSWMCKPERCDHGPLSAERSWVATPEGTANHVTLCTPCGESLMAWWEQEETQ